MTNAPQSDLEAAFDTQWRRLGRDLPQPTAHYRFASGRRWEVDRAFIEHRVAVELEGMRRGDQLTVCHNCGSVVRSRKADGGLGKPIPLPGWHQSYGRFIADVEKYNEAAVRGWIVLRFTHDDVHGNPFAMIDTIRAVLDQRQATASKIVSVSAREREVLVLTAAGLSTPEVARRLGISPATARRHTEALRDKFFAPNRTAAVARALAWGILKPQEIPWPDVETGLNETAQEPL